MMQKMRRFFLAWVKQGEGAENAGLENVIKKQKSRD